MKNIPGLSCNATEPFYIERPSIFFIDPIGRQIGFLNRNYYPLGVTSGKTETGYSMHPVDLSKLDLSLFEKMSENKYTFYTSKWDPLDSRKNMARYESLIAHIEEAMGKTITIEMS